MAHCTCLSFSFTGLTHPMTKQKVHQGARLDLPSLGKDGVHSHISASCKLSLSLLPVRRMPNVRDSELCSKMPSSSLLKYQFRFMRVLVCLVLYMCFAAYKYFGMNPERKPFWDPSCCAHHQTEGQQEVREPGLLCTGRHTWSQGSEWTGQCI